MSQLINVADDVYEYLTKLKKSKNASFSEVIRELYLGQPEKTGSWDDIFAHVKELEKKFAGRPKVKVDLDKIAYGVSSEGN